MTETSTVATANTPEDFRFGSVGKPIPGVEVKIAEDGEVLLRGPNIFKGYYKNEEATGETLVDGWLHTGDLGKIDEDGFVYITGRKKDIIITAGGKNITPANLENGLKQNRWISQAVVVGDRRPYLVALITLDPEEAPAFAEQHGLAVEDLPESEQMRAEVQEAVDEVNSKVGPVEQIKKFKILPAGPVPGDRRADPDAEGQAQRREREVRRRDRRALRQAGRVAASARLGLAVWPATTPQTPAGCSSGAGPAPAPVRYRDGAGARQRAAPARATACSRPASSRVEMLLCLSLFGPAAAGWFWVGSQVEYLTGLRHGRASATIMLGCWPR